MNVIDNILAEAEQELGLDKIANGPNGEPENVVNNGSGKEDIVSMANSFIQKVEQFKAQLQQGAVDGGEDLNQQAIEGNQPPVNAANPNGEATSGGGVTVQTPGGAVIKVASLIKLAALKGGNLFKEVK